MRTRLAAWLAERSPRERGLLAAAAATIVAIALVGGGLGVRDDFATLHARVAAHERDLVHVRALARRIAATRETPAPAADEGSLLTELQAAADAAVGRERIAGMTPAPGPVEEGLAEERVVLRVSGAGLAEYVRLLHALESGAPARHVVHLEMKKHPDDPGRFDATIEVARLHAAS